MKVWLLNETRNAVRPQSGSLLPSPAPKRKATQDQDQDQDRGQWLSTATASRRTPDLRSENGVVRGSEPSRILTLKGRRSTGQREAPAFLDPGILTARILTTLVGRTLDRRGLEASVHDGSSPKSSTWRAHERGRGSPSDLSRRVAAGERRRARRSGLRLGAPSGLPPRIWQGPQAGQETDRSASEPPNQLSLRASR